jgi:hypothetical protein
MMARMTDEKAEYWDEYYTKNPPKLTKPMVDEIMQGAVLRSLTGLLHTDMTIEEIRNERLEKHNRIT